MQGMRGRLKSMEFTGDRAKAGTLSLNSVFLQLYGPIVCAFNLEMFSVEFIIGSTMLTMACLFTTIGSSIDTEKSFNLSVPWVPYL